MTRDDLLERLHKLLGLIDEAKAVNDKFVVAAQRANDNYKEHVNSVNQLWDMIERREGKYRGDATAQSWTRIMHEHYLQAKAIWELFNDDPPIGMLYKPPKYPAMTGKTS